ncbi:hypothetical protein PS2_011005 [Malus domestica]
MPFQAQILPIIMSGRDCLTIGKNWLMQNPCIYIYLLLRLRQIKEGTEIVVDTQGRMTDSLCINGGEVHNLCQVTYLLADKADQTFDMGSEPQIAQIVQKLGLMAKLCCFLPCSLPGLKPWGVRYYS